MDESYKFFGVLTVLVGLVAFLTAESVAPELSIIVSTMEVSRTLPMLLAENIAVFAVMFFVGYPFSRMLFGDLEVFETFFTSIMSSFVILAATYLTVSGFVGIYSFYKFQGDFMFSWVVGSSAVGYVAYLVRGGRDY